MQNHFAVFARINDRDRLLRVFHFDVSPTRTGSPDRARALKLARELARELADASIEDAYGALIPLTDDRTCSNCAHNGSPTAPCGLCAGADAAITRWQPVRVLQQNNDAK